MEWLTDIKLREFEAPGFVGAWAEVKADETRCWDERKGDEEGGKRSFFTSSIFCGIPSPFNEVFSSDEEEEEM